MTTNTSLWSFLKNEKRKGKKKKNYRSFFLLFSVLETTEKERKKSRKPETTQDKVAREAPKMSYMKAEEQLFENNDTQHREVCDLFSFVCLFARSVSLSCDSLHIIRLSMVCAS